jgi:hypothetical protein
MKKLLAAFLIWVVILIILPAFVSMCDSAFGTSGSLTLICAAMDPSNPLKASVGYFIGVGGVLPWIVPLGLFVGTIWWLLRTELPGVQQTNQAAYRDISRKGSFATYTAPKIAKPSKQPKPKIYRLK